MGNMKLFLASLVLAGSALAEPHLASIKIAVTNPTDQARPAEGIVISLADLRKIAPDLRPGALIVTASDAATETDDAAVLQTTELPSQVDDLDGDIFLCQLADLRRISRVQGGSEHQFAANAQRRRAIADEIGSRIQVHSAGRNQRDLRQRRLGRLDIAGPAH